MKIIIYTICLIAALLVIALLINRQDYLSAGSAKALKSYKNSTLKYQLEYPDGYQLDDAVPELVVISRGEEWLRINAGCYDFGTEGLTRQVDQIVLPGRSALKEDFFDGAELKLTKISVNDRNNNCYSFEMNAASAEKGELMGIVKSFQLLY